MRPSRRALLLSLAPALLVVGLLFVASVLYTLAQSLGYLTIIDERSLSLDAYRAVLLGPSLASAELWGSLLFSLWVSLASTLLAALGALGLLLLLTGRASPGSGSLLLLNLNLAFPHLVWAIALSLLLGQSGFLARLAGSLGLIAGPADFPLLVRDRYGLGIILHYISKEIPFLTLILLAVWRSQPTAYQLVAENLGATRWQRVRYVTLPLLTPALLAGSLLVFAFIFGAYEVPAVLGVPFPRMLAALALSFFLDADLAHRAEAMVISVLMAVVVVGVALLAQALATRQQG